MPLLSQILDHVPPSATISIMVKAQALQRAGHDIISLAAGEPDFDTPEHIREAAKRAIDAGKTRYVGPAGLLELREAVADKLRRDNGLVYSASQISVGCGAKQSLFNAMLATINPGDEVIVPAPYWVSYVDIVRLVGGTPVIVSCRQEAGYRLSPADLEAAITARTKWLILCSPSNPSGAAYSVSELRGLAEVLREHPQVGVVVDHIYEHIVYDGFVSATINKVVPELGERTLIVNGLSKGYCMTGWRVGYVAGPARLVDAVTLLQSQSTTSTSTISQWAAVAALQGDQTFIARNNAAFQARRDMVVSALNAIDGISCRTPEGAFYVYPSCAGLIGKRTPAGQRIASDEDFAAYLLEAGVSVVHGAAFGLSPHFRISYAASIEQLAQACRRIADACAALA
jgi:aspartate aminotransferase